MRAQLTVHGDWLISAPGVISLLEWGCGLLITFICRVRSLFWAVQDTRHRHMPMDLKSASSVRGTIGAWGWVRVQVVSGSGYTTLGDL